MYTLHVFTPFISRCGVDFEITSVGKKVVTVNHEKNLMKALQYDTANA